MAMVLHTNWSQGSYLNDREYFLKREENRALVNGDLTQLHPYYDGSISVGYGFDLLKRSVAEIQSYLSLNGVNGTVTATGAQLLNTYQQSIRNTPQDTRAYREDLTLQLNGEITLPSEPAAATLLNYFLDNRCENLISLSALPESKERIAIMSHLYNMGGTGAMPTTYDLIMNGGADPAQRVKIWYEIRYNANLGRVSSLQARREDESNMFGLYDEGPLTIDYSKEVIRYLEPGRETITAYLSSFSQPRPITDLDNNIRPARTLLVEQFGLGVDINGTVWVGEDRDQEIIPPTFRPDGWDKNDLIFGEGGWDQISGGDGHDVLYGGSGGDTLFGDAGDDRLVGGESKGEDDGASDSLNGGEGYDSYYTFDQDEIYDEGGQGQVTFEGVRLDLGEKIKGTENHYKGNGGMYEWSEGTLTFEKDGKTLTISNYWNGALGINLRDRKRESDSLNGTGTEWPDETRLIARRDPLVLDLDGDRIKTVGTDAGLHFDYDNNGFKELTGWVAPGAGMLMLDRNADTLLNNGSELFGDFTPLQNGLLAVNGFQALGQFDANGDGKIDANDPIWSQLKVWQHDPELGGQMVECQDEGIGAMGF